VALDYLGRVSAAVKMTAIVPATDDPATLERCLEALRTGTRPPDETIVVTEPAGAGPAQARNTGVSTASGDVIVFVDSDVVVHADALARIEASLADGSGVTAIFGSYDDSPEAPGAVSAFRNLLHHHVHQAAAGEVPTFWAGLGAIRRDAFLAAGGFDAERYPTSSIEDIELGSRIAANGDRVLLDPAVQGTHLKRWTLASSVRTDFGRRGVPWVELVIGTGAPAGILNLGWRHRASAALSLLGALAALRRRPLAVAAALSGLVALNRDLYALILARRGPGAAVAGVGLHAVHHLVSAAALAAGLARSLAGDQKSHQRT
jgi:GT2 family glycosyltransferase